jgi:hypothetical protein
MTDRQERARARLYVVEHVTGYKPTGTDGAPGEAIVETDIVTSDELADLFGSDALARHLIETGRQNSPIRGEWTAWPSAWTVASWRSLYDINNHD